MQVHKKVRKKHTYPLLLRDDRRDKQSQKADYREDSRDHGGYSAVAIAIVIVAIGFGKRKYEA